MLLPHNDDSSAPRASQTRFASDSNSPMAVSLRERIYQRIARRLQNRVRDLDVQVTKDRIILRGRCATYYSKQLAQHAALGAIEDESLENDIEVLVSYCS